GARESEHDRSLDPGGDASRAALGHFEPGHRGPRVFQECDACRRELDAARQPLEEQDAELALEGLQLLAERRLLDSEPPGRAREAALLGDGDEIAKMAELHWTSHIQWISLRPYKDIGNMSSGLLASGRINK